MAAAAGARVVSKNDVLAAIPVAAGKGEAMWRGVAATSADIVVFVDADLQSFTPDYITALVGPLLTDDRIQLAFFGSSSKIAPQLIHEWGFGFFFLLFFGLLLGLENVAGGLRADTIQINA